MAGESFATQELMEVHLFAARYFQESQRVPTQRGQGRAEFRPCLDDTHAAAIPEQSAPTMMRAKTTIPWGCQPLSHFLTIGINLSAKLSMCKRIMTAPTALSEKTLNKKWPPHRLSRDETIVITVRGLCPTRNVSTCCRQRFHGLLHFYVMSRISHSLHEPIQRIGNCCGCSAVPDELQKMRHTVAWQI